VKTDGTSTEASRNEPKAVEKRNTDNTSKIVRLHLRQVRCVCVYVYVCVRVCEMLPVTGMCLTTSQFLLKKSEKNVHVRKIRGVLPHLFYGLLITLSLTQTI
jgi:hypothetical protein